MNLQKEDETNFNQSHKTIYAAIHFLSLTKQNNMQVKEEKRIIFPQHPKQANLYIKSQ